MESDVQSATGRPRPWLLAVLGVAVLLLVAYWMWPTDSATEVPVTSNQERTAQRREQSKIDPSAMSVRLEALSVGRPEARSVDRNPFRFQPKPPPPPPVPPGGERRPAQPLAPPGPPPDTGPPPPPPIPLKFIGIVEKQGLKVAALSDCRTTFYGLEGQIIDGRYRLIRIGVESMVIEYVDGRGRTTVRLDGCPAR